MNRVEEFRRFDISKDIPKLGFVVNDLASSQLAYTLVYNANEWLQEHYDLNISLFYEQQWLPAIWPNFAQFHIAETVGFDGILVATSASTAFSIKNSTRAKRFFYIQDLEYLRPNCNMKQWEAVMNDRKIRKFTRSLSHRDELQLSGYDVDNDIVYDCDINGILEITNAQ